MRSCRLIPALRLRCAFFLYPHASLPQVSPYMIKRGTGTLIFTSATAAYRGNAGQHAHAAAMGGRRMLSQSLNAELGPQGIHVCHVNVDGPVLAPETIGKMLGTEKFEAMVKEKVPKDELIIPESVADTYFMLHSQARSSWTHDLDIRPWKTMPWFNS